MDTLSIPLFPLNTVLFPGGPLPLRIFEPRYLDMVTQRFGWETRHHIEDMSRHKLRRKLLQQPEPEVV